MRFGLGIPSCREGRSLPAEFAGPREIVQISQEAERLGFDIIWADDHLDASRQIRARDTAPPNLYEIIVTMSYVAAVTQRVGIGIGVLVLPMREPVVAAKQVSTLDVFSGGRITLGLGIGGRDEFNTILPRNRKSHRGRMFDEGIQALRLLFTEEEATFTGQYYEFEGVALNPKPMQSHLPIYIAGTAAETPRRIARWADGCFVPRGVEALYKRVADLKPLLAAIGRDLSEIDLTSRTIVSIGKTHQQAVERLLKSRVASRFTGQEVEKTVEQNLIGTVDEIVDSIGRLREGGMTQLVLQNFAASTFEEMVEQVQVFAEEVMPAFRPA